VTKLKRKKRQAKVISEIFIQHKQELKQNITQCPSQKSELI